MKKKNFYKEYVFSILGLIFSITLILLLTLNFYLKTKFNLDDTLVNVVSSLLSAIIASFCVGVFFDYRISHKQLEDFENLYAISKQHDKSGIKNYYNSFEEFDLNSFLQGKKQIDIYANFANTVLGKIKDTMFDLLKTKGVTINVFILHKENKFIPGLGELWREYSEQYNEEGIKNKIDYSIDQLVATVKELKRRKDFKASLNVYQLKKHPVFYSFYRVDDQILFVPSKIVSSKLFPPMAILANKTTDSTGIYKKCTNELENILESDSLEKLNIC